MRKKIVGILICTLLIATALPVVGTLNIDKNTQPSYSLNKNSVESQKSLSTMNTIDRGAIFSQTPVTPDKAWDGFFSDVDTELRCYENFWNVTSPICDIHWWGFGALWNGTHWNNCDPTEMVFDITFYTDNGSGKPSDEVCSYTDITPKITPTGVFYELPLAGPLMLYYFEYDLDPCCQLSNGWVSVFKVSNPNECIFPWMVSNDGDGRFWGQNITSKIWYPRWWSLAFILTDGEPIITKLDSYGSLIWEDVIPSDTVSGMFQLRNKGENGSVVHWKINTDDLPWGTKEDWTFSQEVGILSTRIDWINVYVNVTAPDKGPRRYKGTITVENIMNPSDFCEIEVKCITPKTKDINRFVPFQRFFENHPNLFPFFRHLLGL